MKKTNMTKLIILSMVLIMIFIIFFATRRIAWAGEPNDSFAQATLVTPGTYEGTVDGNGDGVDYYKFTVDAGDTIWVDATPSRDLEIQATLYRPNHDFVQTNHTNAGVSATLSFTVNSEAASYSYYFVKIEAWYTAGPYSVTVNLTPQNDADTGGDAGDTFNTATMLSEVNTTYLGFLKDDDVDDYYKFTVDAGDTIWVDAAPSPDLEIALTLYKPNHDFVQTSHTNAGVSATLSFTVNSVAASYSYYFVQIEAWYTAGPYSVTVNLTPQNDANTGGDAGDNFNTATTVAAGSAHSGFVGDDDADDYYITSANVTEGQGIYVAVTPSPDEELYGYVYDVAQNQVTGNYSNAGVPFTMRARASASQPFYIRISLGYASGGTYTMKIIKEPTIDSPNQNPASPSPNQQVEISADVTAEASEVANVILSYQANQSGFWTNVTMSQDGTTGNYLGIIPGTSATTNVAYKIIAYDTAGDWYIQDNSHLNYSYQVVPEFSALILFLALSITSASTIVLFKRRRK